MTNDMARPGLGPHLLGPELVDLGPLGRTSTGRGLSVLLAMLVLLGLGVLIAVGILVVHAIVYGEPSSALVGGVVAVIALPGIGGLCFFALRTLQSSLAIHEHGMVARQPFSGTLVISWAEVAEIIHPRYPTRYAAFMVALTSGRWVGIGRLKLNPRRGPDRAFHPHPDTALVLDHYAQWCRRHGRPIAIHSAGLFGK
ncbi:MULTISPECIES: hypothetical protein [unclassified Brachybacterium]|uniref:hypothetical protein n=1 Tax=unclassified Brachybacterium TaxID=2623841 RepID=UPI0040345A12